MEEQNMSEEMVFEDIELKEIPVTVGKQKYVLRAATGAAAAKYKNSQVRATKLNSDGEIIGLDGVADSELYLVHLCLFQVPPPVPEGSPTLPRDRWPNVPQQIIQSWRADIVRQLFDKAKEISRLEEGVAKERSQLAEALNIEGSPISFTDLQSYLSNLDKSTYSRVQRWIRPTPEEEAKN